jgi:hypothetical protein
MAKHTDDEQPESTPAAPDPWAVLDKLSNALMAINQKVDAIAQGRVAETPDVTAQLLAVQDKLATAMERVADATKTGAELQASETRRAHRPSNEVIPGISVFNRRGLTLPDDATGPRKPPLKCLMLLPWIAEWESLTREEVELLNLLQPGEYVVKRIDNSKVRVVVQVELKVDGHTPSRLLLTHETAFNNDNFRLAPGLADMMRQILRQHAPDIRAQAAAIMSDEEEEALIEAGELTTAA